VPRYGRLMTPFRADRTACGCSNKQQALRECAPPAPGSDAP
jgi:hypothetical protein